MYISALLSRQAVGLIVLTLENRAESSRINVDRSLPSQIWKFVKFVKFEESTNFAQKNAVILQIDRFFLGEQPEDCSAQLDESQMIRSVVSSRIRRHITEDHVDFPVL